MEGVAGRHGGQRGNFMGELLLQCCAHHSMSFADTYYDTGPTFYSAAHAGTATKIDHIAVPEASL